ncbi:hypothetical protein LXD69_04845 [Flavobacterium sediminilitoris]|uniref:Uncharacterized protein n=1 Tax=Flavobacterium sediminilitoris TaxID=2024526 RepID=A0ABY4HTF9_9FLAO|nr:MULTISPECIES: hypothetical protein [Flavobacterium]UOX34839.1 hypothetical protein LXD69_04845 [Flavobacterium sediminilitoris]
MKKYFLLFTMIFLHKSFANKDILTKKVYDNIAISILTSEYTEDINKALIVAQYAEILSKEYFYFDKIYITFIQKEDNYMRYWFSDGKDSVDNLIGLNVMFKIEEFNIEKSLKVIEYAIINYKKEKLFSKNLESVYNGNTSLKIKEVLNNRIDRPNIVRELSKPDFLNYYFKNNKYHFIYKRVKIEEEILVSENLFDYKILDVDLFIVFTSYNEFKIIKEGVVIKTLNIENTDSIFRLFKVFLVGENKLLIEYSKISKYRKNVMLYFIDKDKFIQNIDSLN